MTRTILMLPVRLSAGSRAVQTTTRSVTPEAIVVRCVAPLPGTEPPILCRAVVAHRAVPEQARTTGQITGVGVQFLDADDRFREELDRYLAQVQGLTPL